MILNLICITAIGLASILLLRIFYLIYTIITQECRLIKPKSLRSMICIGSGGHTTEMLRLIKNMNSAKYYPRCYVAADNDVSSEIKIHNLEKQLQSTGYNIERIPRSRNVSQSYLTSVVTTLHATLFTIPILYKYKPDIIFCNGPGTCVPICLVAFLMRCVLLLDCRIMFIESICRVRTLSLTGKILKYIADVIIVQWPQLRDVCSRAKYFGRLT